MPVTLIFLLFGRLGVPSLNCPYAQPHRAWFNSNITLRISLDVPSVGFDVTLPELLILTVLGTSHYFRRGVKIAPPMLLASL